MFFESKEQRERALAYKKAFATDQGKIVLYDLMNTCHILNSHKGDPYLEGRRSVVLEILAKCHMDIEKLDKLLEGK